MFELFVWYVMNRSVPTTAWRYTFPEGLTWDAEYPIDDEGAMWMLVVQASTEDAVGAGVEHLEREFKAQVSAGRVLEYRVRAGSPRVCDGKDCPNKCGAMWHYMP
jgi:hypothetical protein